MTEPAEARPSATICLLRDGELGIEVLMGKRSSTAKFMADAWVFPGGRVDAADRERAANLIAGDNDPDQLPWIITALRETVEELGIWLTDPPRVEALEDRDVFATLDVADQTFSADVRYFANWVTPADLPIRYDARFYATVVDVDLNPIPDMAEIDRAEWVRPADAILAAARREWLIPFPTHVTLESLARVASAQEFLDRTAELDIDTIQPRIRIQDDGSLRVIMPGEAGFDELPEATGDLQKLAQAARKVKGTRHTIAEIE
ncbi:MAG: NUDIX domain-containing protein [Acidimicrobiia bacterium]|nr:NUDIX domain-containing protein [Acidimicrobiia bacterium]